MNNDTKHKKFTTEKFYKEAFCVDGDVKILHNREDFVINGVIELNDSTRGTFYIARAERKMSVFTDGDHLVATTIDILHAFAKKIGLKRHYYRGLRKGLPRYNLPNLLIAGKAISKGAIPITSREIIIYFKTGRLDRK